MAISGALRISDTQFNEAIDQLRQFVAIDSVSNEKNPGYNKPALDAAAGFAASKLMALGFKVDLVRIDNSAPFVLAERIVNVAKPTLLLYAHYDVQPVEQDKWESKPFIMEERNGRLYGRGASDDKAGIIAIISALNTFDKAGVELPVNIRILFEGEEEYGSEHMLALIKQEADRLQAHAMVILDGLNRDVNTGTLTTSTRGIVNIDLKVNALEKPVHSGIGCLAPDPAQALAALIYSIRDPKKIPGFMDDCKPMQDHERKFLRENSISDEAYAKENGVLPNVQLRGDPRKSVWENIEEAPSISVVNMTCGAPDGGNSIQDSARCCIGIRVTAGQDPDRVGKVVMKFLKDQEQQLGVPIIVKQDEPGAWAWKADLTKPFSQKYLEALKDGFPQVCGMPCGGALPLVKQFQDVFPELEVVIPAVEDPNTSAHSHNESQDIKVFRGAIDSLISFIGKAGEITP